MAQDAQKLEAKLKALTIKYEKIQAENKKLRALSSSQSIEKINHSQEFWNDIYFKCTNASGIASIQELIRTKAMTLRDTDRWGQSILFIAAARGAYDLVQFLINNGADIDAEANNGDTA